MSNDPYGGIPRREDLEEMQAPTFQATRVVKNEFDMFASFMSFRDVVLSTQGLGAVHALPSETSVKRWARRALLNTSIQADKTPPTTIDKLSREIKENLKK